MRVIDGQGHRNAADDENDGVYRAHRHVQVVAARGKGFGVVQTVVNVNHEQAAEEHDFLHQKDPHADGVGLFLLLHVLKLMR